MNQADSLYEKVRSDIRYNIINGKYPMGMRLKAKDLSEELFVSRTPVNKALSSLYEEGLLNYNRNVGYSVRIITTDDIDEIFKIRTALDIIAFKEAAQNMNEEDFSELKEILEESERAAIENDIDYLSHSSKNFNNSIYDYADMPRLTMIISGLNDYLEVLRKLSFHGKDDNKRRKIAVIEHREILELMENKDYESLEAKIKSHLDGSKLYIIEEAYKYHDLILDAKDISNE